MYISCSVDRLTAKRHCCKPPPAKASAALSVPSSYITFSSGYEPRAHSFPQLLPRFLHRRIVAPHCHSTRLHHRDLLRTIPLGFHSFYSSFIVLVHHRLLFVCVVQTVVRLHFIVRLVEVKSSPGNKAPYT